MKIMEIAKSERYVGLKPDTLATSNKKQGFLKELPSRPCYILA